jgi:hypothetical protein
LFDLMNLKFEEIEIKKDKEFKEALRALKDEIDVKAQRHTSETEQLKIETQYTTAKLHLEIDSLKRSLTKCKSKLKELRVLARGWCERDLYITAGEIWKWAVQRKKTPEEDKRKLLYTRDVIKDVFG